MKCYKIKHIPSQLFLSKHRGKVYYTLSKRGTTWKVKVNLNIFEGHYPISELEHFEV